jgi:protein phosphatase PTC7
LEGVSFGLADGVGGWVDSGVDPSLFSQALMYHAHRYSRNAWAGEPEIDPTMDYEEREQIEGWEMTPYECLDLAYGGVLREKFVQAGERLFTWGSKFKIWKCSHDLPCMHTPRPSLLLTSCFA